MAGVVRHCKTDAVYDIWLGYRAYFFFGVVLVAMGIWSFFFVPIWTPCFFVQIKTDQF
jgi:hypothetical protein